MGPANSNSLISSELAEIKLGTPRRKQLTLEPSVNYEFQIRHGFRSVNSHIAPFHQTLVLGSPLSPESTKIRLNTKRQNSGKRTKDKQKRNKKKHDKMTPAIPAQAPSLPFSQLTRAKLGQPEVTLLQFSKHENN